MCGESLHAIKDFLRLGTWCAAFVCVCVCVCVCLVVGWRVCVWWFGGEKGGFFLLYLASMLWTMYFSTFRPTFGHILQHLVILQ